MTYFQVRGPLDVAHTSEDQVPNPSKVLIILEELNLPYETSWVELDDLKQKPYTDVNPNGRVPSIVDPNHNITLWESGAIVQVSPTTTRIYDCCCFELNSYPPLVSDRYLRQRQQNLV